MAIDTTTGDHRALSIGEASEATGVSIETLRYYERAGLVPPVERDAGGRRRYSPDDCGWVVFVRRLRATAMPIGEIAAYAAAVRAGDGTIGERRDVLVRHRERVRRAMSELAVALEVIDRKIDHYQAAERGIELDCSEPPPRSVRLAGRTAGRRR